MQFVAFTFKKISVEQIIYKLEAYKIIGSCMEVYNTLGYGFLEVVYKDAMEIDFVEQHIEFEREKRFSVKYKGQQLRNPYVADFVLYNSIILEIKSASSISEAHLAQALSYLAVTGFKLAISARNHLYGREFFYK